MKLISYTVHLIAQEIFDTKWCVLCACDKLADDIYVCRLLTAIVVLGINNTTIAQNKKNNYSKNIIIIVE